MQPSAPGYLSGCSIRLLSVCKLAAQALLNEMCGELETCNEASRISSKSGAVTTRAFAHHAFESDAKGGLGFVANGASDARQRFVV